MKTTSGYPKTVWLQNLETSGVSRKTVTRETSRSWVTGQEGWSEIKYSKRRYREITEAEGLEHHWAERNWRAIRDLIGEYTVKVTPAQLRQIAEIIGYEEKR